MRALPSSKPPEPARDITGGSDLPRPVRVVPRGTGARPVIPRAVRAQEVPKNADLDHPALYFNRELGLLDFNWRVFAQAVDDRVPLLERVRFLAITTNNLDEFFQKRVGGLKRQVAARVQALSIDGRTPSEQLAVIHEAALEMHGALGETWEQHLRPLLHADADVVVSNYGEL